MLFQGRVTVCKVCHGKEGRQWIKGAMERKGDCDSKGDLLRKDDSGLWVS